MRNGCVVAVLLASLAICCPGQAAKISTLLDVEYGSPGGVAVKLDAYLVKGEKPAAVLVFIHGGGWRGGDKKDIPVFLKRTLPDAGISVVSVNYRLSDRAPYPAQVDDCTRAVQFVRSKAKEWNIDAERVGVMGPSAGGHLSLWVGLHDDRKKPESPDPVERESSQVCCIVNYFGPTDFRLLTKMEHRHPAFLMLFGRKAGESAAEIPKGVIEDASPIMHVSPDDPPVFTAHGTADDIVPKEHALALIEKLKEKGVAAESYLLEGGNHGLSNRSPKWPDFRAATISFLKKYLLE